MAGVRVKMGLNMQHVSVLERYRGVIKMSIKRH